MIHFACPNCGRRYVVDSKRAGKKTTCVNPLCQTLLIVPELPEPVKAHRIDPKTGEIIQPPVVVITQEQFEASDNYSLPDPSTDYLMQDGVRSSAFASGMLGGCVIVAIIALAVIVGPIFIFLFLDVGIRLVAVLACCLPLLLAGFIGYAIARNR